MLLTTAQIARQYGVHKNTIYKMVKKGMPVRKIGVTSFRFDQEETDAWLKQSNKEGVVYEDSD